MEIGNCSHEVFYHIPLLSLLDWKYKLDHVSSLSLDSCVWQRVAVVQSMFFISRLHRIGHERAFYRRLLTQCIPLRRDTLPTRRDHR